MISIMNRTVELNWANYLQKHNPKLKANNKSDFWTATIRTQKIKMWQPLFHHLQQKKQHIELSYLSIWPSNNRWWHFQNCWFWVNKLTGLEKLLQFRKIIMHVIDDGSNIVSSYINWTRTSCLEPQTNSNVFIYW